MTNPVPATPTIPVPTGKRACVIGAGFGGLALAIRLQSAGIETVVVEARDKPGGRGYHWQQEGFTFDAGPTVITDPACLTELWGLTGHDMAEDVTLMPVMPFYRLNWPDGTNFDYSNDEAGLAREIARVAPGDLPGYEEFLRYSAGVFEDGYVKLGHVPFLNFASMIKAAPSLAKHQAWRSVYSMVSSFIKSEKLREALSFHTLLVGGNPMATSSIYALIHKLEKDGGLAARCGCTIRWFRSTPWATRRPKWNAPAAGPNGSMRSPAMPTSCIPTAICCHPARAARRWRAAWRASGSHPACSWSTSGLRAPGPASRTT